MMESGGAVLRVLACALLGACSTAASSGMGGTPESDWSKDLVGLIPAIDACRAAAPKFRTSPGTTVSIARHNPDSTTTVRLGDSSLEPIEDPAKVQITHYYWECTVAADGRQVAKLETLPKGAKRLPGESHPSFMRAEPMLFCVEGECLKNRVFAPNGELLGYLHYRDDPLPDSLNSN